MTYGIGKISDIFAHSGVQNSAKGRDATLMTHLHNAVKTADLGSLTFANFVEFDSLFGHRRDVSGYARALEWFDAAIGPVMADLRPDDMMVFTADHGNDPTWPGTDHTREAVPILATGPAPRAIGRRGFVDVGASIAHHLGLRAQGPGRSFL
jgi:phosphopentomutase